MDVTEVLPPDAIPSVDAPTFGPEYFGEPDDEVIAVEFGGQPRAYPVRILHYHEIVNDLLEDRPIAITWCPLCGSAVVYSRRVDGRTLTFGVSGKLADDDLIMYDRETESEWKQTLGRCIAGPLEGHSLEVLPAAMTTWGAFRAANPDGVVLQPPGGESEAASDDDTPAIVEYDVSPYEAYFEEEGFGLGAHRGTGGRAWDRTDIEAKAVVLGIEAGDDALGIPRSTVERRDGVVQVSVGPWDIVVFSTADGLHAYDDPGFTFGPVTGGFRGDDTVWDGATGIADDGRRLDRIPAKRLFAFAWQDDHGSDAFYGL